MTNRCPQCRQHIASDCLLCPWCHTRPSDPSLIGWAIVIGVIVYAVTWLEEATGVDMFAPMSYHDVWGQFTRGISRIIHWFL